MLEELKNMYDSKRRGKGKREMDGRSKSGKYVRGSHK